MSSIINTMLLFRTDLRIFEDYHYCDQVEEYKKNCWDFYVNQGIWAVEKGIVRQFIVCRLKPKIIKGLMPISWVEDNHCIFRQLFIDSFNELWRYNIRNIDIAFFRGGFKCYDQMIKDPSNLARLQSTEKLYCGSGRRVFPQYGGKYDLHLLEDKNDFKKDKYRCVPFYKTANPKIFYNMNIENKQYDICFPANFSSKNYKGQDFLIQQISKSKFLKSLKIVNIGNHPEVGKKMCRKYGVNNITFLGHLNRHGVNKTLNSSKFGLVCSNRTDGCPRVVSEILCTGTPLLLRNQTRLLDYYKKFGVQTFSDNNISEKIEKAFRNYEKLKIELNDNINRFNMDTICGKNFDIWAKNYRYHI